MSNFDLKPFEVKRTKYCYIGKGFSNKDNTYYECARSNNIDEVAKQAFKKIDNDRKTYNFISKIGNCYDKDAHVFIERVLEPSCEEWTFEDVQVGWFFKCSDGDLYWKHEHGEFRSMGRSSKNEFRDVIEFSHFFVLGTNLDPDPDLRDLTITNVYDCPELANVLMIEKVIT